MANCTSTTRLVGSLQNHIMGVFTAKVFFFHIRAINTYVELGKKKTSLSFSTFYST